MRYIPDWTCDQITNDYLDQPYIDDRPTECGYCGDVLLEDERDVGNCKECQADEQFYAETILQGGVK